MANEQQTASRAEKPDTGAVRVCVRDGQNLLESGSITLHKKEASSTSQRQGKRPGIIIKNDYELVNGCFTFTGLEPGNYDVTWDHEPKMVEHDVKVECGCTHDVCFDLATGTTVDVYVIDEQCNPLPCAHITEGTYVEAAVTSEKSGVEWIWRNVTPGWQFMGDMKAQKYIAGSGNQKVNIGLGIPAVDGTSPPASLPLQFSFNAEERIPNKIGGNLTVSHKRRIAEPDGSMSFFVRLLDFSKAIEFGAYRNFIDSVFGCKPDEGLKLSKNNPCFTEFTGHDSKLRRLERELTDHGVGAYELLKTATEAFLLLGCCIKPCDGENGAWPGGTYLNNPNLGDYRNQSSKFWQDLFCSYLGNNPYIQRVIDTAFPEYEIPDKDKIFCSNVLLRSRVDNPCFMELIWNYWHEEGMLVQSMNAVSRRFQNLRAPGQRDPLVHMEIDPLRPLNNILWGYVEDERGRLSIKRRAYEYQHHYGLNLYGKAVSELRPADNRSKFIEAFHNLLNKCADYYRAKQDTTVDPDGYPILHAIQELNLILAQGAHNQFGDLPWTSRVEMLMQQWIMARPEMRDFLQSRPMVPYKEEWMPQVDTMKTLQGWSDVVITHFRDLGVFGEQILLTIRWYNWYDVTSEEEAKGWADLLRAQIQTYIHAYRAVTGVDLSSSDTVDYTMPSVHLRKRLALQQRGR